MASKDRQRKQHREVDTQKILWLAKAKLTDKYGAVTSAEIRSTTLLIYSWIVIFTNRDKNKTTEMIKSILLITNRATLLA